MRVVHLDAQRRRNGKNRSRQRHIKDAAFPLPRKVFPSQGDDSPLFPATPGPRRPDAVHPTQRQRNRQQHRRTRRFAIPTERLITQHRALPGRQHRRRQFDLTAVRDSPSLTASHNRPAALATSRCPTIVGRIFSARQSKSARVPRSSTTTARTLLPLMCSSNQRGSHATPGPLVYHSIWVGPSLRRPARHTVRCPDLGWRRHRAQNLQPA
jgi:hypothetical protein